MKKAQFLSVTGMIRDIHCWYCGTDVSYEACVMDHQTPVSRGGTSSRANLVPSCKACNSRKSDKTLEEYRSYLHVRTPACRAAWYLTRAALLGVLTDSQRWDVHEITRGLVLSQPKPVFFGESGLELDYPWIRDDQEIRDVAWAASVQTDPATGERVVRRIGSQESRPSA